MNRRPGNIIHQSRAEIPPEQESDRIECAICHFKGVSIDTVPGESSTGSTQYTVTGSTYVWTAADDDIVTTIDKKVLPVPNVAVSCPFCGGERFLDGSKGSGNIS